MLSPSSPESSLYRITLFFGPEAVDSDSHEWRCVFNVKKRSWKGGIQVGVDIAQTQLEQSRLACGLSTWINEVVQTIPPEDRPGLTHRIDELFIQAACACKLDLALQLGLTSENQTIPAVSLVREFEDAAALNRPKILSHLCAELDLGDSIDISR